MKNTKYKFTGEMKEKFGVTLKQIEAIKDFRGVKVGDIGGWIEKESNLSVHGNAWVADNACVFGNAKVIDNVWISGNACAFDYARVFGDARVYGNAWVFGDAWVCGNARVFGQIKLKAGLFIAVRWKGEEFFKEIEIEDGTYLIYKGNAEFGTDEDTC